MSALGATRVAGISVITVGGRIVVIASAALGIAFAVLTVIGPSVWVFSDDGSGAGSLLALPLPLRLVRATAALLACFTVAVAAFLLVELARRLRAGVTFVPTLTRTVTALAITIGAGSWLAQIASNLARWSWVVTPDGVDASNADPAGLPIEWNLSLQTLAPNWPMLGIALIFGVLASILRSAERLQRETEGLV